MSQSFVIYSHPRDRNDATFKYLDIITDAFIASGYRNKGITNSLNSVAQGDIIVTINCAFGIRALLQRPGNRLVHWFQGIEPEERMFLHGGWKGRAQWMLWSWWEGLLMRRANLALFVSTEMQTHLERKHNSCRRAFIMPCFNTEFDAGSFDYSGKYDAANLVYAGSMHPWQRVEAVIAIYRELKKLDSATRLTLLTREVEEARRLCAAQDVSSVDIRSVPASSISAELRQFSHGFILRNPMPINTVSTPTKLSSYMAAGVIPVLTTATPALTRIAADTRFKLCVEPAADPGQVAKALYQLYVAGIDKDLVCSEFERVFSNHFNESKYAQQLADLVRRL